MRKMKKGIAVALTATMVLGSSLTAFASEVTTGTGNTTGAGSSEGHVDKEKLNVVLPTVEDASSPFKYTMDPERLIQDTDGVKYGEDYEFPASASDTGVYFKTGDKKYENTSSNLQVINKSSCDVTLTVDVEKVAGTKDIALVASKDALTSATAPSLYLAVNVGKDAKVVGDAKVTATKTIAGNAANFTTTYESNQYVYKEKADASSWKAINISMTGAVNNKQIATDTTAPSVKVTWTWAKAADGATVDTVDQVDYTTDTAPSVPTTTFSMTASTALDIPFSLGIGTLAATEISSITWGGTPLAADTQYTVSNGKVTLDAGLVDYFISAGSQKITINFNDTAKTSEEITLNP